MRADNAALARQLATRLERDPSEPPSGNESLTFRSAFVDEKLYWAVQLDAEETAAFGGEAGEPGVIRALPFLEAERERETERRY